MQTQRDQPKEGLWVFFKVSLDGYSMFLLRKFTQGSWSETELMQQL